MSRLWDTPEYWARQEADEMLRDYPDMSPAALALSFRKTIASYDGGIDQGRVILAELKRRADAGVRFWTGPTALSAEESADLFAGPAGSGAAGAAPIQYSLIDDDEIPW